MLIDSFIGSYVFADAVFFIRIPLCLSSTFDECHRQACRSCISIECSSPTFQHVIDSLVFIQFLLLYSVDIYSLQTDSM